MIKKEKLFFFKISGRFLGFFLQNSDSSEVFCAEFG